MEDTQHQHAMLVSSLRFSITRLTRNCGRMRRGGNALAISMFRTQPNRQRLNVQLIRLRHIVPSESSAVLRRGLADFVISRNSDYHFLHPIQEKFVYLTIHSGIPTAKQ